jgi:hypothetical protein
MQSKGIARDIKYLFQKISHLLLTLWLFGQGHTGKSPSLASK